MKVIDWHLASGYYEGYGEADSGEKRKYTILHRNGKWKLFYDGRRPASLHPTLKTARSAADKELLHVYSSGVFAPLFREVGL